MNTPVLRAVHPDPGFSHAVGLTGRERVFEVVRSGAHGGSRFRAGDLLVCAGHGEAHEAWVLEPRGHGRPVLGHCVDGVLLGSVGEKCHPVRWSPAGAVRGQWRRVEGVWTEVCEAAERQSRAPALRSLPGRRPQGVQQQLPLFAPLAA